MLVTDGQSLSRAYRYFLPHDQTDIAFAKAQHFSTLLHDQPAH